MGSNGIVEKIFEIKEKRFHIFDVGGQKSERRKWIKCFDDVDAIVFVISLSCYNKLMFEDSTQTKMEDAIQLFENTIGNKIFKQTPIIVDPTFDDFDGSNAYDYGQTTAFIREKFKEVNSSCDHMMYVHLTCALDEEDVSSVFKGIDLLTMRNNLIKGGLI